MEYAASFDKDLRLIFIRFGSEYLGASGNDAIVKEVGRLPFIQRTSLRQVLIDCSEVLQADLRHSDRAKLGLLIQRLDRLGVNVNEFLVCVVSTHPTIQERYERQKGPVRNLFQLRLVKSFEEAEHALGMEPGALEEITSMSNGG